MWMIVIGGMLSCFWPIDKKIASLLVPGFEADISERMREEKLIL
jgi:hypothetical protein